MDSRDDESPVCHGDGQSVAPVRRLNRDFSGVENTESAFGDIHVVCGAHGNLPAGTTSLRVEACHGLHQCGQSADSSGATPRFSAGAGAVVSLGTRTVHQETVTLKGSPSNVVTSGTAGTERGQGRDRQKPW